MSSRIEIIPGGDQQRHVILGENSAGYTAEGEIISTQTVSSKTRTVETITVSDSLMLLAAEKYMKIHLCRKN